MKQYHWVQDDVILDFEIHSKPLQNLLTEAEELDLAESGEYFCVADMIDVFAKNMVVGGLLSQEQWGTLCRRYPQC